MIAARALSRTFPGRSAPALDRVSFSIAAGEIVALAGRNGAGKTSLLDVLSTLLLPSAGEASIAGFDIARRPDDARRHVGYAVSGPRGLYTRLTARQNLAFFAALHPQITDPTQRVEELVALLGLEPFIDEHVRACSDGMQQRIVIARALLGRPRALLLDEPARALDPVARRMIGQVVDALVRSGEVGAVLYATHDLEALAVGATRALVLSRGRLVYDGIPDTTAVSALLEAER